MANLVAENMLAQSDPECQRHVIFKEIVGHQVGDNVIKKKEGFTIGFNGNVQSKKTTRGWDLICVEWRDSLTSWLPLKDVKDANPLELAQYAIANGIAEEPAFKWWVQEILKKKCIIAKIRTKYWCTTHKFNIKIPKLVEQTLQIVYETGTNYWKRAIKKEIKSV